MVALENDSEAMGGVTPAVVGNKKLGSGVPGDDDEHCYKSSPVEPSGQMNVENN